MDQVDVLSVVRVLPHPFLVPLSCAASLLHPLLTNRPEEGERGDGREPPQGRVGWGSRWGSDRFGKQEGMVSEDMMTGKYERFVKVWMLVQHVWLT